MKLLSKPEIKSKIQKSNEDLIVINTNLRKVYADLTSKINLVKAEHNKDKLFQEFEKFCDEILHKKSILLKELKFLEEEIDRKREIIYGFTEKQDEIMEKENALKEREIKLDLREEFIKRIESKIYGK